MNLAEIAGIIAGGLALIDFVLYDISIIRGKTRPNRATWFILSIVGIIIFSSYYSLGARDTLWMPLAYTIGPVVAFILSIKMGEGGWTTFDKVCLLGAGVSIILWWQTGSALVALLTNIVIDMFGLLPTVKKSYLNPASEEFFPWFVTVIACIFNIFAIQAWEFNVWVYPIYMLLINGVIAWLLYYPRFRRVS